MKYIDAEKLIAVVEQYLSYYRQLNRTRKVFDSVILPLEELLEDITSLQQEQSEEGLEEAAEKYLDSIFGKGKHEDFYVQLFKAGAKWDREQMMKTDEK